MKTSEFVKIRVTVPEEYAAKVREMLGKLGAGQQGQYDFCSFSCKGMGRFRPRSGANPAIGKIDVLEEVNEEIVEVICHQTLVREVITGLKKVHPYEEPAIDILPRLEIE